MVFSIRLITGILGKFQDEKLHLQSTSLAYTTLLSLVPFLAVTFSVLKGFGVQNQLEPMLMQSLEPLGDKGAEIGRHILTYVGNLNFAVLGSFGIALLFWTVISLLTRVEQTFNTIWHVPDVRGWTRRFSDYLSVALVGPVFVFAALGVTAIVFHNENVHRVVDNEYLARLIIGLGRLVPYLLVGLAFAFLYAFLTNYRVRLIPALTGGIFAGVAWRRLPVCPVGCRLLEIFGRLLRYGRGRAVHYLAQRRLADRPGRGAHRPLHPAPPPVAAPPEWSAGRAGP